MKQKISLKGYKEFLDFKEMMTLFKEIDLSQVELEHLKALGKRNAKAIDFIAHKSKNHIATKVLNWDLSVEYGKWAVYAIQYIKWLLK